MNVELRCLYESTRGVKNTATGDQSEGHGPVVSKPHAPNSFGNAALVLKPPPHALVSEIDRLAEHERAAPDDAVNAVCLALSNGLL